MVQGSPSNVAMPANLSQPRVPPVTNHMPGLPNDISALSQFQPTSQMLAPVVPGQPWLSFKRQSAAFATPVLQTGQQPPVIPSTDSVSVLHFLLVFLCVSLFYDVLFNFLEKIYSCP